jgi:RHS repeat-associated protein
LWVIESWTKAGLIIEYGNSAESALNSSVRSDVISWSVNRISDTSGNYMEFRYSEDTVQGSQRLERINYTGNTVAGSWPYASVQLSYEDRPDPVRGYLYGCAISATKRLTAIKAYHGDICVRSYTLGYTQRPYTSRSVLASLTETGEDGKSYPPLTFEYSNPQVGWDSQPKWAPPQQLAGRDNLGMRPGRGTGFVDLDGDGRADFIRYYHGGTQDYTVNSRTGTHILRSAYLNDPVQGWVYDARFVLPLGYPLATDSTSFYDSPSTRLVDINGDGFVDVGNRESVFHLGSANGFSTTPSVRWNLPWNPNVPAGAEQRELNANFHLVDINGDGLLDYVGGDARYYRTYQEYDYDTHQYEDREEDFGYFPNVWINAGPGPEIEGAGWKPWEAENQNYALPPSVATPLGVRMLDLNGDGLVDIVRHWQNSTDNIVYKAIVLNTGTGWNELAPSSEEFTRLLPRELFSVGKNIGYWEVNASIGTELTDLNGDGLVDQLRRYEEYPYAGNKAYFNTGNGWVVAPENYQLPVALASNYRPSGAAFLDIDSDGLVDCLQSFGDSIRSVWLGAGTLGWSVPTAAGYAPPRQIMQPGAPAHATGTDFVDVNADGAIDQVWNWAQPGQYNANASINRRVHPDRLTKVISGLGVSASIKYAPLTATDEAGNPTVYTKGAGSVYPVADIIAPMYVVKAVSNDDGAGGEYKVQYQYGEYRAHAQRGGLGFGFMSVYDTRTKIRSTTEYSQDYPFVGMPVETTTTYQDGSAGGIKLSESTTTYGQKSLNGGKTRFVFPSSSTQKSYNFDTPAANDVLTEAVTVTDRGTGNTVGNDYDSYGNSLYLSVTTTGAGGVQSHSKVTTSTYDNIIDLASQSGTSRWYLGRLSASSVTATSPTDSQTRSSSFTYENSTTGLLKTETIEPGNSALSLTTTYGYDSFGNKTTVVTSGTGVANRSASTIYDTQGRFPLRTLNALGHEETYTYDPALGVVKSTTGPNGLTTSWEYDGFARKTKETRADGTVSLMHYRWTAAPTVINGIPTGAVYHIETESSGAPPAIAFYDRYGRTIAARSLNGGGLDGIPRIVGSETYFDSMGRAYRSSLLHYLDALPSEIAYAESTGFDAFGRPTSVATPTADGTAYSYVSYSGFTTETTNPKNQVERVVKNAQGQVVERINNVTTAANSDERGRVTFTYDAYGQLLTTVVHKNDTVSHTTTLEYDSRGRKKKMIDPDMGTWEYGYNAFGELVWQKDAKLQYTELAYDVLGRLTSRKEYTSQSATDPVITTWTYDTASGASLGKLHTVVTTGSNYNKSVGNNETYTYDSLGRPANVTRQIKGKSFTSGQTYDSLGRPQYTIYPSGFQTKNVYSTLGFLREVRRADNGQNELYWAADSYALDGRVNGEYYGNGLSTDRVYNQRTGRLEMVHSGIGADSRAQYLRYTYDVLGNVLSRADEALKRSETFTYDGLNRLTAHSAQNIQTQATTTVTVAYDSLGNIRSKSDVGNYTYGGPRPHAVTFTDGGPTPSSAYDYDSNGNMETGGGRTYSWTLDNKPWRIEQGTIWSEFTFDSSRQRTTQKTNLGSTTYYVGGAYEEVRTGSNDATLVERKHYIMAPTGRVAVRVEKNSGSIVETRWFHQDGLGSINAISKETGEIAQRFAYDAWGKRVNGTNGSAVTSSNNEGFTRGYTDHEHLEDLGLIHMNGRVYDPTLARFVSADPLIDDLGDAQSYNRFSYVNNNPLKYTDPSGYSKFWRKMFGVSLFGGGYLVAPEFFNKYGAQMIGTAVSVVLYIWAPWLTPAGIGAISGFASGFSGSLLNGGSLSDAFKAGTIGAAIGAATGYLTSQIGAGFDSAGGSKWLVEGGRALAHGAVGGGIAEATGGEFRHGFYGSFMGSIAGSAMGNTGGRSLNAIAKRTAIAAVAGGTASVLGGGKFANGAMTSAFQHLFNQEAGNAAIEAGLKKSMVVLEEGRSKDSEAGVTIKEFWENELKNLKAEFGESFSSEIKIVASMEEFDQIGASFKSSGSGYMLFDTHGGGTTLASLMTADPYSRVGFETNGSPRYITDGIIRTKMNTYGLNNKNFSINHCDGPEGVIKRFSYQYANDYRKLVGSNRRWVNTSSGIRLENVK